MLNNNKTTQNKIAIHFLNSIDKELSKPFVFFNPLIANIEAGKQPNNNTIQW